MAKRTLTDPKSWFQRPATVAVLRLYGAIGAGGGFGSRTLAHASLERAIEAAFKVKRVKAVALAINSPGGAPAQSGLIARHIRRLSEEKDIPVVAFCEDVAASGGYLIACAAQEIFVDEYSVTGSIGVISASFGATEAIEKLGIERRVYTAGERKVMLDPFSPEREEDVARIKTLQREIHARFINWVKTSRGERLSDDVPLFEGDVWVGEKAIDVGLVDGVGHLRPVMRERFGEDVRFQEIATRRKGLLSRLRAGSAEGGAQALASGVLGAVEERALWARHGV